MGLVSIVAAVRCTDDGNGGQTSFGSDAVVVAIVDGTSGEGVATAEFTIRLAIQPSEAIVLNLSSTDESEARPSVSSISFHSDDWNVPKSVMVVGVDDDVADGSQSYAIEATVEHDDPNLNGLKVASVELANTDDDEAGFVMSGVSGNTSEDGDTARFTVRLQSQPLADVQVMLSSSDPSEATVSPRAATFGAMDWNTERVFTIVGQDDNVPDGTRVLTIQFQPTLSDDPAYNEADLPPLAFSNVDNDTPGVLITRSSTTTREGSVSEVLTLRLMTEPSNDVTVLLSSSNDNEIRVETSTIVFQPSNWSQSQTATLAGIDDFVDDGNQDVWVHIETRSTDANYASLTLDPIPMTNLDNDTAGFTVSSPLGNPTEDGDTATFAVRLDSQPLENVVLALSSTNEDEVTVSPQLLTFTPQDWGLDQVVTITGRNDDVADGSQTVAIQFAPAVSDDPLFSGLSLEPVLTNNLDNDSPGLVASAISGDTGENGTTATFTIRLLSQPTDTVTVSLASSREEEGTVLPSSVTFTPSNWAQTQTATVTGEDDDWADGPQSYIVNLDPSGSTDLTYAAVLTTSVALSNLDDDTAGFVISEISNATTESGDTATFSFALSSRPFFDVVVTLQSSNPGEGTISTSTLAFEPETWDQPQVVTVTGVDDNTVDGSQDFSITFDQATSADQTYAALTPASVSVTNLDNEPACGPNGETCQELDWVYLDPVNGIAWAWASPCSGGCSTALTTGARGHVMEGWRFPTNEDWAVRPDASEWGSGATIACASEYFDPSYTHCDWHAQPVQNLDGSFNETWFVHDL